MQVKIGCSVPFGIFTGSGKGGAAELCAAFGDAEAFLDLLGEQADAAELRSISKDTDPRVVLNAVKSLKSRGLTVTLHGTLSDGETFFLPYHELFSAGVQDSYNITVHPAACAEDTEKMLREICSLINFEGYPVHITLENQRMKPDKDYGRCDEVAKIAAAIDSPHLSLCYDFGHQLTNERGGTEGVPTSEFLTRVSHTHIHGLYKRTHFPLTVGACKLDRNLMELFSLGYGGILNLELSPDRYRGELDVKESLIRSIAILKVAAYQASARLAGKKFYKNDYERTVRAARAEFDSRDDCAMLVGASAYVLKLRGVRIAIDVTPKIMPIDDTAKGFLYDWISEFDAHIVTHDHADHYDPEFIDALPASVKKIIPDFMPLETAGRVTVSDGSELSLGDVTLSFFTSGHFLDGNGVPEYGIAIAVGGETLLFPTDVRDYEFVFPHFDNVRALFSHLWLGRGTALKFAELLTEKFCKFVKQFNARECYVAHLIETSRDITNMWSDIHLDQVREHIPEIKALAIGEITDLSRR